MGQYWIAVNLDKKEKIRPHAMGDGAKLGEFLEGNMAAGLVLLCAAQRERRGGGDLNDETDAAKQAIGRWAGDRVALLGDYAEDSDLPGVPEASKVYSSEEYADISGLVKRALEDQD